MISDFSIIQFFEEQGPMIDFDAINKYFRNSTTAATAVHITSLKSKGIIEPVAGSEKRWRLTEWGRLVAQAAGKVSR